MPATKTRPVAAKPTAKPTAKPAAMSVADPQAPFRRAAELLKQVSEPTRLQILTILADRDRNVTELCADLGIKSQPSVSHHLALMRHGRLIESRRAGKNNFYALTETGQQLAVMATPFLRSI